MTKDSTDVAWVPPEKGTNIAVNVPSLEGLLADLRDHFADGRGFSLATLNLDHVVKLRDDATFRAAYLAQSHVTADGNPIVWLSRLSRRPVSLLPGSDLIAPLADLAASMDVPVGLLGSTEETLEAAAAALEARHQGLRVVARVAPPMGFDPTGALADKYIAELEAAGVGLCFLALGAPKQELFAAHAMSKTDKIGFVSIGAGLDFIAGTQTRAPKLVRLIAAEWLWRMLTNPRRLAARYASCFGVLPRLLMSALRARRANGRP
ncbi:MAG: WecB/TagA/CpsF family glycosyltransferase [Pseudomonadota bacterium]